MPFRVGDTAYIPLLEPHEDDARGQSKANTVAAIRQVVVAALYDSGDGVTGIIDRSGEILVISDTRRNAPEYNYSVHETLVSAEIESRQQYLNCTETSLTKNITIRTDVR